MPGEEFSEPFLHFVGPLNQAKYRYMITGSVAAMMYGEPRMTNDVDLVLFLTETKVEKLTSIFPLESFYCPPEEVLRIEANRPSDGHFNLIHHASGFKADVYLAGRDPLMGWAIGNATSFDYLGERVPIAPPEYIIIKKLEYFRDGGSEKHLRDIRAMEMISGEKIDYRLLTEKLEQQGLSQVWQEVNSES